MSQPDHSSPSSEPEINNTLLMQLLVSDLISRVSRLETQLFESMQKGESSRSSQPSAWAPTKDGPVEFK